MINNVSMNLIWTIKKTLAVALLYSLCGYSFGGTIYVDANFQGEKPNGESWFSAFPSLNSALEMASTNAGSQIWVRAGYYKPEGTSKDTSYKLPENTALYGGFRGGETNLIQRNPKTNRTILSGDIGRIGSTSDNAYHVITTSGNTIIDGLIVQRGNANSIAENRFGGGMLVAPGSENVIVANCTFEKNTAESGGAIQVNMGELTLTNCTFYSNSADSGGAIACLGESSLKVIDSTFSSNFAPKLGGAVVINDGGTIEISNCSFLYNSADDFGGAVAAVTSKDSGIKLLISESSFSQNSARNNGGALGLSGPFIPEIQGCSFDKNFSTHGAGAIANRSGVSTTLLATTFTKNRGYKGLENIGTDESSSVIESQAEADALAKEKQKAAMAVEPIETEPEPEPEPEARKLPDVYVYKAKDGSKVKIRSIIADAPHTVIVLGDLTDDDFITSYRNIEAAARDYYPKGIRFHYIYKYLKHPENNGYIKPFSLRARARHSAIAKERLRTAVPWLYDTMENETADAIGTEASLYIFSKDGTEVYKGNLADNDTLRRQLTELSSPVTEPFDISKIAEPDLLPIKLKESKFVPRANVSISDKLQPLEITPNESRSPFFVKARIEGSEELLKSGDGKLYLGFHIDPLFKVEWNNLGEPLKYQLKTPQGVVAPSVSSAARVTAVATDSEPREFILQARKLDVSKPLNLQVTYSVHTQAKRNIEVTQSYTIYLQKDKFGGEVIGRQIELTDKTGEKAPVSGASENAFKMMLRRFDIDRNGKLTEDEVIGRMRSSFDEIDTNNDGAIDAAEYGEYREGAL